MTQYYIAEAFDTRTGNGRGMVLPVQPLIGVDAPEIDLGVTEHMLSQFVNDDRDVENEPINRYHFVNWCAMHGRLLGTNPEYVGIHVAIMIGGAEEVHELERAGQEGRMYQFDTTPK